MLCTLCTCIEYLPDFLGSMFYELIMFIIYGQCLLQCAFTHSLSLRFSRPRHNSIAIEFQFMEFLNFALNFLFAEAGIDSIKWVFSFPLSHSPQKLKRKTTTN